MIGPYLQSLKSKWSRFLWCITGYAWRIKNIITSKENIAAKSLSSMAGGLGLTFLGKKEDLKYPPRQMTATSPCNSRATVLNEEPMFLWIGSLPDPVRTAQGTIHFTPAHDIKAVVTYCLPSSTSSVLQQLSSLLLPLMVSGLCPEKPTDRNCIGMLGMSHLFPKHTADVHWVNPNVEWVEVLVDKKVEDVVELCNAHNEAVPQGTVGYEFGDGAGREAMLLQLYLLHLHFWL